jgi:hypothetical protein
MEAKEELYVHSFLYTPYFYLYKIYVMIMGYVYLRPNLTNISVISRLSGFLTCISFLGG